MRLLEQYQSRLHGSNDGSEEELVYIKQILASPLFQQYLNGGVAGLPQKEKQEIVRASADILNGIEGAALEDVPISPTERRRWQIHRKQSLKALRNAVTPKNSPVVQGKMPHSVTKTKMSLTEVQSLDSQASTQHQVQSSEPATSRYCSPGPECNGSPEASSSTKHDRKNMGHKSNSASKVEQQRVSHTHVIFPVVANGGPDHGRNDRRSDDGYGPTPSHASKHEGWVGPMGLMEARAKNLSSSSSMLIERPSPPKDYPPGMMPPVSSALGISNAGSKVSREGLFGGGIRQASMSGSQPNISRLRITQQGELEFDDLLRDDEDLNPREGEAREEGKGVGGGVDWNNRIAGMGSPGSIPAAAGRVGGGSGGMKLTLTPVSPPVSRPPPPYQFNHAEQAALIAPPSYTPTKQPSGGLMNRRTKSYEKLMDIGGDGSLYPNLTPLVEPMTNGKSTRDLPTAERRKTSLVIQLRKGKEGLGFMLKGRKKEQKGELCIQELQQGGVADR